MCAAHRGVVAEHPRTGRQEEGQERGSHVQKVLGEHQDSAVALGTLRTLGAHAGNTDGENGFTFGLLYGLELQAARRARDDAARLTTYTFEDRS